MPRTSTDLVRHALSGPVMGTRWSALFYAETELDRAPVRASLQSAVAGVDAEMSVWKPGSDLMRLNRASVGAWVEVPAGLANVLDLGLAIGRASGGAFDIGMGDAARAWGFGPDKASAAAIRAARAATRLPAHEVLEIDHAAGRARKHAPLTLDLNGIAKGYGVDRLAGTPGNASVILRNAANWAAFSAWSGSSAQARWLITRTGFIARRASPSVCGMLAGRPRRFMPVLKCNAQGELPASLQSRICAGLFRTAIRLCA